MLRRSIMAALAFASMTVSANADDVSFPPRRPGLWERSTVAGGNTTSSSTACADQATDRALMQQASDRVKQSGGTMTITGGGNQFHIVTTAHMPGHTMTSESDMTFVGNTEIRMRGRTTIEPPFDKVESAAAMEQDTTNKWIGPCPPDLQPGEVLVNGRKLNLLQPMPAQK